MRAVINNCYRNAIIIEFKVRDSGIAGEKHRKICQAGRRIYGRNKG